MEDPSENEGQSASLQAPPGLTSSNAREPELADATERGAPVAGLDPGDPLLRRAQEALGAQLAAAKLRLEAELREKRKALSVRPPIVAAAGYQVRPSAGAELL